MTRRSLLGLGLAAAMLCAGVACEKTDAPTDPVWGKQACAHCGMLVGERRYAAQAAVAGERKYFDDIGCMILFMEERKVRPDHTWVHAGDAWLDAAAARYANDAKTPMDFGLEARAPGSAGTGLGWDEARAQVLAKGRGR